MTVPPEPQPPTQSFQPHQPPFSAPPFSAPPGGPYPPLPPPKRGLPTPAKVLIILSVCAVVGVLALCGIGAVVSSGTKTSKVSADNTPTTVAVNPTDEAPAPPAPPVAPPVAPPAPPPPPPPPVDPPGPKTYTIGDTVKVDDGDGNVATVKLSKPTNRRGSLDGHNYLVVTVDISASAGSFTYNPLYFSLKDSANVEHEIGLFSGADDDLSSGDLPAGQKVHGTLAFEVPASTLHGSQIQLTDPIFQTVAYWKLP